MRRRSVHGRRPTRIDTTARKQRSTTTTDPDSTPRERARAAGTDGGVGALDARTGDALRCFDPAEGIERWTRPGDVGDRIVVADDLVYTTTSDAVRAYRSP